MANILNINFSGVKAMVLYANQAIIAMGIMAGRIPSGMPWGENVGRRTEDVQEMGVAVTYAELIL